MENKEENIVFGRHAVFEALQQGKGDKLFVQQELKGEKIQQILAKAKEKKVPVVKQPKANLEKMAEKGNHQGVVLRTTPFAYADFASTVKAICEQKEDPFFLILDRIEDPHNLGSILRTCDATGVDGVIIPKHRACGITPIVAKTSTGAIEHVPVMRVTNLTQAVKKLKDEGFWIFGTDMQGSDYRSWNVSGKVALIIGNEGKGMQATLKKEVDELLTIPMVGHVQSLNASVASGLLLYEMYRFRHPLGK